MLSSGDFHVFLHGMRIPHRSRLLIDLCKKDGSKSQELIQKLLGLSENLEKTADFILEIELQICYNPKLSITEKVRQGRRYKK